MSEFLASNRDDLRDEDGDASDWIEIQNSGPTPVSLDGWYLTDDALDLSKWRFPAVELAPGSALIVFASGKDRRTVGRELHTNFELDREGEYLALVRPDGRTIAHDFAPRFPPQREDISYGLDQTTETRVLVGSGAALRWIAPADDNLQTNWRAAAFADDGWNPGALPIGFDRTDPVPAPTEENLALGGTAEQSSTGFGGAPGRAIDGDTNGSFGRGSVTHTSDGDPAPWWQVDLGDTYALSRIVLWNRTDCCTHRLTDFRLRILDAMGETVASSDWFPGGATLDARTFEVTLPPGTRGRTVRIERLGPDREGEHWLSLAEVEVFGGETGIGPLVSTDVGAAMLELGTSLYVRLPFTIEDPAPAPPPSAVALKVRYDDGFALFLDGEPIASANAPPGLSASSAALGERALADALRAETFDLGEHLDRFAPGAHVLAIHALNARVDDADLLIDLEIQARSSEVGAAAYFLEPSPGAANSGPRVAGFAPDVVASIERGFFDAPFSVELSSADPDVEIRYTLDGSPPAADAGELYSGPVAIQTTTTLRARAFREGFEPGPIATHTYVFPADVVHQDGAGFPRTWGTVAADYEMDPNVVNSPAYRETIEDDLLTIPSLSIVLPVEDLFGPRGIYTNSEGRGDLWERACSMELLYPDGAPSFQTDCGLRIFGYGWRSHSASMKHSFRLVFSRKYGPAKLHYAFFPGWPVEVFDDIVLRSQGSRGWNDFRESIINTQYIRDAWARYTARDMGKTTTQSTYVHLYLNGLYWGLYNPVERPDAEFMTNHFGGREEDYDALNARVGQIEVIDGSRARWDRVMALSRSDVTSPEVWDEISALVDLPDLVRYMLIQFYTANRDWPGSNGNNMRLAGGPDFGVGFKSFLWDMEYSIWNAGDNALGVVTQYDTPATLHARLRSSLEYRTLFGDFAHRHLTHDGALTPERAAARWMDRASEIDRAIVGESARWGDRRREPPYTRDVEWIREQQRLLTQFFPQRTEIFLSQLQAAGLYPRLDAPELNHPGQIVSRGFEVTMSAPLGRVFYTLDGTDPRLPGGAIAPEAIEFGAAERTVLLAEGAAGRFHVPVDARAADRWFETDFDDSGWMPIVTGIGFDRSEGYEEHITTDVGDAMFRVNSSGWLRVPFDLAERDAGRLFLRVKYDDGFVAWLNGVEVASRNAPDDAGWDSAATASHGDANATVFEDVEIPDAIPLLQTGRNVLAVQVLNTSKANADLLFVPRLEAAEPFAPGDAITIERSTLVRARALRGAEWSALSEAAYVLDETPPVRITEILFHPPRDLVATEFEPDDYEWLEIQNIGDVTWDAGGTRIRGGIELDLPHGPESVLAPGAALVIVRNREAFRSRYGEALTKFIAGEYSGRLSNAGDRIVLEGAFGEAILDFSYEDTWYPGADGDGFSIEVTDSLAPTDRWSEIDQWRLGAVVLGTPGEHEWTGGDGRGLQLPSDANQDGNVDLSDAIALLSTLFGGGGASPLPCDGGSFEGEGNRTLLDANGDQSVNLSDAVHVLAYLFQGGPPPTGGTNCVRIRGCPEACAR